MSQEKPFNNFTKDVNDLSRLAIEIWRLKKKINKVGDIIGEDSLKSISLSMNNIESFLEKNDLEVIDFTGHKYSDGINVDVLSFNDENKDTPIISETIEPMVKHQGSIVKRAKVIVTK